ncbi:hypothetical protein JZU71_02765, partial [bacterium]|nr:hypothetical protein [bacterium]
TGMLPFLILLILSTLLIIANKFHLPTSHLFLLAGVASLSLLMARNIPLFAICTAPILALSARNILDQLQAWIKIESRFSKIDNSLRGFTWTIAGILAAITLFSNYQAQTGSFFNQFDANVFMDSQTDFYGETLTRDYSQIIHTESGWQATLQNYEIDWVIIPSSAPLAQALETELHWRILYQDETSIILRK